MTITDLDRLLTAACEKRVAEVGRLDCCPFEAVAKTRSNAATLSETVGVDFSTAFSFYDGFDGHELGYYEHYGRDKNSDAYALGQEFRRRRYLKVSP